MIKTINICDNVDLNNQTQINSSWYRSDNFKSMLYDNFDVTYHQKKNNWITFFVTHKVQLVDYIESQVKIAVPTDTRDFQAKIYKFIENNINKFDYVITYDEKLINNFPNKCLPTPAGHTWIWPECNQKIWDKSYLISYITSVKNFIPGHAYRIEILEHLYQNSNKYNVHLYGDGHNPLSPDAGKLLGLKDYAFHITMENHKSNYYFSEKLIDVFLCGTVPIYWGCKNIANYFDMDGIITFDKEDELYEIINNLSMNDYNKRYNAIKTNYELAKQYRDKILYAIKNNIPETKNAI